ncbi:hypothetical protein UM93_05760 [Psychromicrobium lacuslunae]|uniref:Uncharacterized protein n=1 Tax=Psychromicrobium lacuslunae TaxID=1618207 RepID=A0A0D4BXG9_9MICC|nr:hypothetical protein UM93_05760 [Psychromicrobium lacuslunae]
MVSHSSHLTCIATWTVAFSGRDIFRKTVLFADGAVALPWADSPSAEARFYQWLRGENRAQQTGFRNSTNDTELATAMPGGILVYRLKSTRPF